MTSSNSSLFFCTIHSFSISSQRAAALQRALAERQQAPSLRPVSADTQERGRQLTTGCPQLETLRAEAAAARSSLLLTDGTAACVSCQTTRRQAPQRPQFSAANFVLLKQQCHTMRCRCGDQLPPSFHSNSDKFPK